MPLAPRLHSTRGGSARAGQNVSMSRTGIEEATNSVAAAGSSTPSSAATAGSDRHPAPSASKDRLRRPLVRAPPAGQPVVLLRAAGVRERAERGGRLQGERPRQDGVRVLPRPLGIERHLTGVRQRGEPRAQRL